MTRTRSALLACSALAAAATAAVLITPPAVAASPSPPGNTVRFATFNASLNRATAGQLQARPVDTRQRAGPRGGRDHPAGPARRAADQRVRLRRRRHVAATLPAELPVRGAQRRCPDQLSLPVQRPVEHRHRLRLRPEQLRRHGHDPGDAGLRGRRARVRCLRGSVRHGRLLEVPDRPRRRPDVPELQVEGHAGSAASRRRQPHRHRPTGTPRPSWPSCRCRPRATGTCRSRSASATVHFLVSHPTPPVFDGAEDRNGRRNNDEIRLWADYVTPGAGGYIYDDEGGTGGLGAGESFVIAGDQNSDPLDGDSIPGSIQQLLDNPRVNTSVTPTSGGGVWAAETQGEPEPHATSRTRRRTPPTSATSSVAPGRARARATCAPTTCCRAATCGSATAGSSGPPTRTRFFYLTGPGFPVPSSDHRSVWVDVKVPGGLVAAALSVRT